MKSRTFGICQVVLCFVFNLNKRVRPGRKRGSSFKFGVVGSVSDSLTDELLLCSQHQAAIKAFSNRRDNELSVLEKLFWGLSGRLA